MNKKSAKTAGVVLLLFASFLLLGTQIAYSQEFQEVRVGIMPILSSVPFFFAVDKGFFQEEGIKIKYEYLAGGAAVLPAISGGSLDIGYSNYLSIFLAREQGFDFTIVTPVDSSRAVEGPLGIDDGNPILVLSDSGIKGVSDLKGKRIAVNTRRNINHLYASEWVQRAGVDPIKDVTWLEVPFPKMGSVLRSGEVHAAMMVEPFVTIEKMRGGVQTLGHPYAAVHKGSLPFAGFVASAKWLKNNLVASEKFSKALYKGMRYAQDHPEERPAILAKYIKGDPELLKKIHWGIWRYPIDVAGLQEMSDLAFKWGWLKQKQQIREFIHSTALQ